MKSVASAEKGRMGLGNRALFPYLGKLDAIQFECMQISLRWSNESGSETLPQNLNLNLYSII